MISGTTRTDQYQDSRVVDMGYHYPEWTVPPWQTVSSTLTCTPPSGIVYFVANFMLNLTNNCTEGPRRFRANIDAVLASGLVIDNWKGPATLTVQPGASFDYAFNQPFPNMSPVIGMNTFILEAEDVTPAPYNQPPYPPSGDTDIDACTVIAIE
jgi:hypothetical protein